MIRKLNLDALGVTASIACAIHCAVLPLVVASLPILGVNILHNTLFEYGMISLAFAIGTTALWHGFKRHHHRLAPWLLFTGGMSCLIAKEIYSDYELVFLPFAVLLIVGAHWLNYRWCRKPDTRPSQGGGSRTAPQRQSGATVRRERSPAGGPGFADFPDPAITTGANSLTLQAETTTP